MCHLRVMSLYRGFLFASCILTFVIHDLHAESLKKAAAVEDDDLSSSVFGFRPCMDESCSDPSFQNIMAEGNSNEDYEPQQPDTLPPIPDAVFKYCLPLHASTLEKASIIDKQHPDTTEVKVNIIEGLIKYTSDYASIFKSSECPPEIKILDFIVFAAETLKQDYVKAYGKSCEYSVIGDEEADKHIEGKAVSTSTTPRVIMEQSTTPGYVSTDTNSEVYQPSTKGSGKTAPKVGTTPLPDHSVDEGQTEEIIAEDDKDGYLTPILVGSVKGIPGVHFPNYTDVPITSFSCADKYIPGFYADLETGCQVFHVCYEHRRESFLCPVGTTFNQPILACDYWYSSNCSLAVEYYEANAKSVEIIKEEEMNVVVDELISVLEDKKEAGSTPEPKPHAGVDIMQFLPVKAKVTEFPKPAVKGQEATSVVKVDVQEVDEVASQIFDNIVSTATKVVSETRGIVEKIPEPSEQGLFSPDKAKLPEVVYKAKPVVAGKILGKAKLASLPATKVAATSAAAIIAKLVAAKAASSAVLPVAAMKTPVIAKAKLASAVPLKVAAMKTVPIVAKAKLSSAVPLKVAMKTVPAKVAVSTAGLGVAKGKLAATVPKVAVPVIKAKAFAPVVSAKAKVAPTLKIKAKFLPVVKSTIVSAPLLKTTKVATAAAISPLTKKALALGYMKLLKAKKLALMG